jgi:hypothetical protein
LDAGEDGSGIRRRHRQPHRHAPPELLRKGRFDEIFFVDLPTSRAVREQILSIHLKKKRRDPKDFDDRGSGCPLGRFLRGRA